MVASNYLAGITLGVFNEDNTEVGFYTLALTVTTPLSTLPAIIGTTYSLQSSQKFHSAYCRYLYPVYLTHQTANSIPLFRRIP